MHNAHMFSVTRGCVLVCPVFHFLRCWVGKSLRRSGATTFGWRNYFRPLPSALVANIQKCRVKVDSGPVSDAHSSKRPEPFRQSFGTAGWSGGRLHESRASQITSHKSQVGVSGHRQQKGNTFSTPSLPPSFRLPTTGTRRMRLALSLLSGLFDRLFGSFSL